MDLAGVTTPDQAIAARDPRARDAQRVHRTDDWALRSTLN